MKCAMWDYFKNAKLFFRKQNLSNMQTNVKICLV